MVEAGRPLAIVAQTLGKPSFELKLCNFSYNADNDIGTSHRASATSTSGAMAMKSSYSKAGREKEREESKSGYAGMSTGGSAAGKRLGMNSKTDSLYGATSKRTGMGDFTGNVAHFERPLEDKNDPLPTTMTKGKNL